MQVVFPREPLSQKFCHTEASLLSFKLESRAPEVPLSHGLVPAGGQRGFQAAVWAWDRPALLYYKALDQQGHYYNLSPRPSPLAIQVTEVDPEPELSLCQFAAAATFPFRPSLLPPLCAKNSRTLNPVFL